MPDKSEDFTDIIERAQRVSKDLGGLFGDAAAGRVAFEPRQRRAGPEHDFDAHVDVFVIPTDSDAYEDILNQSLRGEAIIRWERDTFTKDGDFMVAVCWLTPRDRPQPVADGQEAGDAEVPERPKKLT